MSTKSRRIVLASAAAAGPASAHVTVSSTDAAPGGYGEVVVRVPSESESASTTKVAVTMPAATPFVSVRAKPHPGWNVRVDEEKLPEPVQIGDLTLADAVRTVTWTAHPGQGIAPGLFDEFELSIGPFPEEPTTLIFPAVQTYGDGPMDPTDAAQWRGAEASDATAGADRQRHRVETRRQQRRRRRGDGVGRVDGGRQLRRRHRHTCAGDRVRRIRRRRGRIGSLDAATASRGGRLSAMTSVRIGAAGVAAWVFLGIAALILLPAAPASAHAELIGSTPKDGARVNTVPVQVQLEFSEEVGTPAFVEVKAADATDVTAGDPDVVGATVTVPLNPSGPAGEYTIDYRVVSADGHPVSGELTFVVATGPATGPTAAAESPVSASAGTDEDEGFISRHQTHILVAGVGLIAGALLVGMGLRARR